MAIFTENIGKVSVGKAVTWDRDAALLYALSIGAGRPDATEGIDYTTESSFGIQQKVFPTFAVVLGGSGGSMDHLGDFKLHQILHGGQSLVLHCELPPQGSVTPRSYMSAVYDQGKNAIIELTTELADPEGQLVATSVTSMVIRGETGYGPRPERAGSWAEPGSEPDAVIEQATSVDQALLYRLNGDRNPLHSDPVMASKAGFPRPVLHGLCTYGMAALALVRNSTLLAERGLGSINARFAAPVFPGQVLETRIWNTAAGALFQVLADGKIVLDRGVATAAAAVAQDAAELQDAAAN
ncbi:MaoC/PaaZ C-terminal domain-containing protein [Glutamicibacter sp.]|uniref:MaoC family dehydratase n=1 Tax=Glutamicibacter sp. TaxID=1931995 RepID=UPI003D6A00AB